MSYLRALREKRRLSQRALGALLGVGYKQVSRWERGENEPSAALLAAYALAVGGYDTTIAALLRDAHSTPADGKAAALRDLAAPPPDTDVLTVLRRLEAKIDAVAADVKDVKRRQGL